MPSPLLTVAEASERTGLPARTLRSLAASRRVACYRVGRRVRFREEDLVAFLEGTRVEAKEETVKRSRRASSGVVVSHFR